MREGEPMEISDVLTDARANIEGLLPREDDVTVASPWVEFCLHVMAVTEGVEPIRGEGADNALGAYYRAEVTAALSELMETERLAVGDRILERYYSLAARQASQRAATIALGDRDTSGEDSAQ